MGPVGYPEGKKTTEKSKYGGARVTVARELPVGQASKGFQMYKAI